MRFQLTVHFNRERFEMMKKSKFPFNLGRHKDDEKRVAEQPESNIHAVSAMPMHCPTKLNTLLEEQILADSQEREKGMLTTELAGSKPFIAQDRLESSCAALPAEDNTPHENPDIPGSSADGSICSTADTQHSLPEEDDSSDSRVLKEPSEILQQPPLLGNSAFVRLVEECIDIMNEFDRFIGRLESEEGKTMAGLVVQRLQESLERSGLTRISDEERFAILRHIPVPMVPVVEGVPLAETLVSGLAIENRVFRKAKVTLKPIENR